MPSSSRPPKGGVGEHDVHAVAGAVADVGAGQGVVVTHKAGVLNAMEQHISDAEHVRELLLFHGPQGLLHDLLVFHGLDVALLHVADGAGEEAARAAGGVKHQLAGSGVDAVDHEGCHGAGRVVFARVARALQVVENLLVDVAEVLAVGEVVEVNLIDLVDDLTHELTGLHVVVGVLEYFAHHAAAALALGDWQFLERWEHGVVDELQQRIAGDALGGLRPNCAIAAPQGLGSGSRLAEAQAPGPGRL